MWKYLRLFWKHIVIFLLSISSLIIFVFILLRLYLSSQSLDDAHRLGEFSNGFSNPTNYIFFWSIIVVSIIQGVFSKLLWNEGGRFNRIYALTSFLLGGLGLHILIIIAYITKKAKSIHKISINRKIRWIALNSFAITLFIIPFLIISFLSSKDPFGGIIAIENFKMSTNKNAINLIENFSDGLDGFLLSQYLTKNRHRLKDFTYFKKYLTPGQSTARSLTSIFQGMKGYDDFIDGKNEQLTYINMKKKHFEEMKQIGDFDTIINWGTYGDSFDDNDSIQNTSGSVHAYDKFKSLNVKSYNFHSIKENITNNWGVTNLGVDTVLFRELPKKIEPSITTTHGTHVIISDEMLHGPYVTHYDGTFAPEFVSLKEVTIAWVNEFEMMIKRIPREVYDNSLIIVFSDHGSHSNIPYTLENIKNTNISHKPWGSFLIKLPFTYHDEVQIIDNRLIYAPYIRNIIKFILDKQKLNNSKSIENEFLDSINTNPHFDPSKSKPVWISNNKLLMVSFKGDQPEVSTEKPNPMIATKEIINSFNWELD